MTGAPFARVAPGYHQLRSRPTQALCSVGTLALLGIDAVAPGTSGAGRAGGDALNLRVGVIGGMATTSLPAHEMRTAALEQNRGLESQVIRDRERQLRLVEASSNDDNPRAHSFSEWPLGNGQLVARIGAKVPQITTVERLLLSLPLLMWVMAALISWVLVTRLLIRPLRRLERAVTSPPGESANVLPTSSARRPRSRARDAFARAVTRIEQSEHEMAEALDGQRRLVREVHIGQEQLQVSLAVTSTAEPPKPARRARL